MQEPKELNITAEQFEYLSENYHVPHFSPRPVWSDDNLKRRADAIRAYLKIEPGMYVLRVDGELMRGVMGV